MLVYDVSNESSFQLLRKWFDEIKERNPDKNLTGVVVANKIDLENRAMVSTENGQ